MSVADDEYMDAICRDPFNGEHKPPRYYRKDANPVDKRDRHIIECESEEQAQLLLKLWREHVGPRQ